MAGRAVAWNLPHDALGLPALPVAGSIYRRGYRLVHGMVTQPRCPLRPPVSCVRGCLRCTGTLPEADWRRRRSNRYGDLPVQDRQSHSGV